jgi:putative oxygen-independent coproporphyrinogen III oxidase
MRAQRRDSSALNVHSTLYFEVLPRHLYVHVPFCARRCVYCDFSIAVRRTVPVDEYVGGIERELELRHFAAEPLELDTLYFGGGTPSRLGADGVARLIDAIRARVVLAPDAEVTLEANPEDVTPGATAAWRAAGVNRLSLGAQSFDDRILRWMHRTHDSVAIERAVDAARASAIDNLSLDLIFGLPEELERAWDTDLSRALALSPQHISLYGLTIEPHTPLGRAHHRGQFAESPDDRYEREFLQAHEVLTAAGFEHYEVSNYGVPGRASRHNSSYWSGAAYAGLGPSAHGYDGCTRRWNRSAYTDWLAVVNADADPVEGQELLTAENRAAEDVYLGLRTANGLVMQQGDLAHVTPWIEAGWAAIANRERLVLTASGWLRLDAIAADLTVVRSRY